MAHGSRKAVLTAIATNSIITIIKFIAAAFSYAAVKATLERTEQIIDELIADLKRKKPQASHATIEIEGIATTADKK